MKVGNMIEINRLKNRLYSTIICEIDIIFLFNFIYDRQLCITHL